MVAVGRGMVVVMVISQYPTSTDKNRTAMTYVSFHVHSLFTNNVIFRPTRVRLVAELWTFV